MSTRTKDDDLARLRELLRPERREELLRRMSPERRELFDRIVNRRDRIGPIGFDIVEVIRELRDNG